MYDSNDQVITTAIGYSTLDILLPGRKSPFTILLLETEGALNVDDYSLTISWTDSDETKQQGLEILSSSQSVDSLDFMHVTGEIKNIGTSTATSVIVSVTFYDSTGTVVGRDWEYAEPQDLSPNQTGAYDVELIYDTQIAKVSTYSLTAEAENYALIPEFPTITVMFAALAVIAVVAFVYQRKLTTKN
ncbi:MAG: FxLYD domain-containing protein [Candidatus Bathyarchaeia archaeon]